MTGTLYRWPVSAAYGRIVPKTKFYEHGNVRSALREKFVGDIRRITWAYKLADSTVRLKGTIGVPEIQVFTVESKVADVSEDVLTAIDKSVHFPIVFEVVSGSGDRIRLVAAHKTLNPSKVRGTTPKLGRYFSTGWFPTDMRRAPLPTALDLPNLYEMLLASLLPEAPRSGESVSHAIGRMERARKLEREIVSLEKRLRTEVQLNRKVELRHQLKDRTTVLAELVDNAMTNRGPSWRS